MKCEHCKKDKETIKETKLTIPPNSYGKRIVKNLCAECRKELWELVD